MRDCGDAGQLHAIREPAQPDWMQAEESADFRPLGFVTFAACETLQSLGGFDSGLFQFASGNLGAEALEELHEDFDVGIHVSIYRDASAAGFCKKSSKIFRPKNFFRVNEDFLQKAEIFASPYMRGTCVEPGSLK